MSSDPLVVRVAQRWFPLKTAQRFVCRCQDPDDRAMVRRMDYIWELIDYYFDFLA